VLFLSRGRPLAARDAPAVKGSAPRLEWQGLSLAGVGSQLLYGADFYREVGRDELAQRFSRITLARGLLIGVGFAAAVAGAIIAALGFTAPACDANAPCATYAPAMNAGGITLGVAGLASVLVGTFLDPHPIPALDQQWLVQQHNEGAGQN
jgi:hypothetical protein